jgi:hypothetical protein
MNEADRLLKLREGPRTWYGTVRYGMVWYGNIIKATPPRHSFKPGLKHRKTDQALQKHYDIKHIQIQSTLLSRQKN